MCYRLNHPKISNIILNLLNYEKQNTRFFHSINYQCWVFLHTNNIALLMEKNVAHMAPTLRCTPVVDLTSFMAVSFYRPIKSRC